MRVFRKKGFEICVLDETKAVEENTTSADWSIWEIMNRSQTQAMFKQVARQV